MNKEKATNKAKQRQIARLICERNMLLETVLLIRKIARHSPDEHMFFVGACDEALEALAEPGRREKKRKN